MKILRLSIQDTDSITGEFYSTYIKVPCSEIEGENPEKALYEFFQKADHQLKKLLERALSPLP